jgi:hypothetical protein
MNYIAEMKLHNNVPIYLTFFRIRETLMVHKKIRRIIVTVIST